MLNAIKTIQKPHKKIFISCIIVSFIMFFSVFSIAEGWHFRGGTVEDIINGIKQTVEKVKQSEIAQQYGVLKEYQKEYNSVLKELKSFGEEVQSLAHADIFDMKLDGVLAAQNQTQKDIKERMMEIDFSKEGLTSETLKENSKRFDAMQEQEILNTVQRANQMQDFETAIQTQVDKILADRQAGVISETQKNLLLKSLLVQTKNANAIVANQAAINDSAELMRQRAEARIVQAIQMQNSFAIPDEDNEYHRKKLEEAQMDRLPR